MIFFSRIICILKEVLCGSLCVTAEWCWFECVDKSGSVLIVYCCIIICCKPCVSLFNTCLGECNCVCGKSFADLLLSKIHTVAELCVILKQWVWPSRTVTVFIYGVRCWRSRAAPNWRTACCVRNIHLVAVKLCGKFCIWCFAATCASTGELKIRLFVLNADCCLICYLGLNRCINKCVEWLLNIKLRCNRLHCEWLCRTNICTWCTTGTVKNRCDKSILIICSLALNHLCSLGSGGSLFLVHTNRSDHCMRTNHWTKVTLCTLCRIPFGNINGNASLFKCGRTLRINAVCAVKECGNGKIITVKSVNRVKNVFNKLLHFRSVCRDFIIVFLILCISPRCRNIDFNNFFRAAVDTVAVWVNNSLALLWEFSDNLFFHISDCFVNRENTADGEKCRLKNCWCTARKTNLLSNLDTVDCVEVDVVLSNISLHWCREICVKFLRAPNTVKKECSARKKILHHIIFVNIWRIVAGNKICLVDKICWCNRWWAETKVRYRDTAGFLWIVEEITLSVHIGMVADNLDRVLICTYSTIRAETPEFAWGCALRCCIGCFGDRKWKICNIILDWKGKCFLWLCGIHICKYRNNVSRKSILWA